MESACSEENGNRKRRATNSQSFSGPAMMALATSSASLANDPPKINKPQTSNYVIQEDSGSPRVDLQAELQVGDDDLDPFIFWLNDSVATTGDAVLSADGALTYTPCENCFGTDTVHFAVIESDTVDKLVTFGTFTFEITPVNDGPRLMILHEGADIADSNNYDIDLTMEENQPDNAGYTDLDVLSLAFDVDFDDKVTFITDGPHAGHVVEYIADKVKIVHQDCTTPWESRRAVWNDVIDNIKSEEEEVEVPLPCEISLPSYPASIQPVWKAAVFTYTPNQTYHGQDTFKVRLFVFYHFNFLFFIILSYNSLIQHSKRHV